MLSPVIRCLPPDSGRYMDRGSSQIGTLSAAAADLPLKAIRSGRVNIAMVKWRKRNALRKDVAIV